MFNPDQASQDLTNLLLSSERLQNIHVTRYRNMRLQNMTDFNSMLEVGRNGRAGAAIVVLEPYAQWNNQVNMLVLDWYFPVVSIECPAINDVQGGTNLTAYQIAQIVADEVFLFADPSIGRFRITPEAINEEPAFKLEGCVEKRATFKVVGINTQSSRTATPAITTDGSTVSIASESGSQTFYTLEGSFPANQDGGNPNSVLYTQPFPYQSGATIRARSYVGGKLASSVASKTLQ